MTTTAEPTWSQVDDDAGDLLDLIADDGSLVTDYEWDVFKTALTEVADVDGVILPNLLRPRLAGRIKACKVGAFTRRALLEGLVVYTGEFQISDDLASRNRGKPARVMRLTG